MNSEADPLSEELYRAAVGAKRADFYVPKFLRFDELGASKASWNWPALFVPFYWGLYRRLYGPSVIYCMLMPLALTIFFTIIVALTQSVLVSRLFVVVLLGYYLILIPVYANMIYHRAIARRIRALQAKVPDPAVQITVLENGPHTSALAWVIVLFMFIPVTGIVAAIAIPAYQDYTIRSQVTEGLTLATPIENAVTQEFEANRMWPADLNAAKYTGPVSGTYVADIRIDNGTISIQFGNRANGQLANQVLSLRPVIEQQRIIWNCGYEVRQGGEPGAGSPGLNRTTVRQDYLPSGCRG
jgi:hypothetical protein